MWAALIRNIAIFMFTKRGKKLITLFGAMLLCFITALLLDSRLYLSATVTGILAAATLMAFAVQHFRQRRSEREREQRKVAEAVRRAEAAEARSEKMDRAKASIVEAAKGVSSSAAGIAGVAKTGFTEARGRLGSWRSKMGPSRPNKVDAD